MRIKMMKKVEIKQTDRELRDIEKLFLNYKGKYKKIDLDWDNEVGKEIWYNDKRKNQNK